MQIYVPIIKKTDFSILMISNCTLFCSGLVFFLANFDAKYGNSVPVEINAVLGFFFFFSVFFLSMEYLIKCMCKRC